jgi:hypothetical protein
VVPGRVKRAIGDSLRSWPGEIEAVEVAIATAALNRMLASDHASYFRIV